MAKKKVDAVPIQVAVPRPLHSATKSLAAARGLTLKQAILRALEQYCKGRAA